MSNMGLRIFLKVIYSRRASNPNSDISKSDDLFQLIDFLFNNNLISFSELAFFPFYKPNNNNSNLNLRMLSSDSSLKEKEKSVLCDISNDSKKNVSSIERRKIMEKRSKKKHILKIN